ncbi:hydrolase [Frondihabitans sp. PAMC 28766]|nr:hydrolase [Frondihabitans sp. PAMC 28766]
MLVLHGGGGPFTVRGIAQHAADTGHRALLPTLPGWNGAPRAASLTSVPAYATLLLDLLAAEGLTDVVVIGSSLGGWLTSELAAQDATRPAGEPARVGAAVVIDGAGVKIPGEDFVQFFALTPREIAEHSWHDADRFFVDPATQSPEQIAAQRANMATMGSIAGDPYMHDPSLLERLPGVQVPTLVLWGESDRVFPPSYGRAYAEAFGDARFELIAEAGHLPQLEQPERTLARLDAFVAAL